MDALAQSASGGRTADAFSPVARTFFHLVGRGGGGGAMVVRLRGETVVRLHTGCVDREGRRPWTPETLAISFSTTKGAASTLVHQLIDRGALGYDDPVSAHWPEFAAGGKQRVSVRDLLTHRAGLYNVQAVAHEAEDLLDHIAMEEKLAALTVHAPTRHSAYHAFTYGWLVAGLVRRVTGRGLKELVQSELAAPLRTKGLHIGAPEDAPERVAEPVGTALRQLSGIVSMLGPLATRTKLTRAGYQALIVPGFYRLFEGAEPPIWTTEMPAVNGMFSADALARLYGALANGGIDEGERILSERATHELGRVQVRSRDAVLGLPMRWRLGFHQAFGTGPVAPKAFGHYGYGGSGGWADPTIGLSVGFVTNRIGSLTTPMGDLTLMRLNRVVRECAARVA